MGRILIRDESGNGIIDELAPIAGEKALHKPGKGAFYNTGEGPRSRSAPLPLRGALLPGAALVRSTAALVCRCAQTWRSGCWPAASRTCCLPASRPRWVPVCPSASLHTRNSFLGRSARRGCPRRKTGIAPRPAARPCLSAQVCVQTSMREANDRGFDSLLVTDATASYFPEFKESAIKMITAQVRRAHEFGPE